MVEWLTQQDLQLSSHIDLKPSQDHVVVQEMDLRTVSKFKQTASAYKIQLK